jgi:hypothetical protein
VEILFREAYPPVAGHVNGNKNNQEMGFQVRTIKSVLATFAAVAAFSAAGSAASLSEQFSMCVAKFANPKVEASVMLECTAADGKLTSCKVLEAPSPLGGFDKAAMCVADAIPVGSKTGSIKVPVKFNPA